MFYWSNWHPNPLNKGFESPDFKNLFEVGVRSGPQRLSCSLGATHCSDKGQVKSVMLSPVVHQPRGRLLLMIFRNNGALGGPGLLEKEHRSVETRVLSLG